jgi:hypothetical protein
MRTQRPGWLGSAQAIGREHFRQGGHVYATANAPQEFAVALNRMKLLGSCGESPAWYCPNPGIKAGRLFTLTRAAALQFDPYRQIGAGRNQLSRDNGRTRMLRHLTTRG